jgi:hypothetical protein
VLEDPSVRARWKNVTFGDGNDGAPEELFATPGGAAAAARQEKTKADPPEARRLLEGVEEAAGRLREAGGTMKPADPRFARRFRSELLAIGRAALRLSREHPDTESSRRALAIAEELNLRLPD